MNRSYSKIRHIQESNRLLEKRVINEQIASNVGQLVKDIVGFILVIMFFLISYSVIISSLRTAIDSRGQELEVMRLVGAKDSYMTKPFMYQGVFFSAVSSFLSSIVIFILGFVESKLGVFSRGLSFGFLPKVFMNPVIFSLILAFILILSGFVLGYFGSKAAVKKYLKY